MFLGCLHASLSEKPLIHPPIKKTQYWEQPEQKEHIFS